MNYSIVNAFIFMLISLILSDERVKVALADKKMNVKKMKKKCIDFGKNCEITGEQKCCYGKCFGKESGTCSCLQLGNECKDSLDCCNLNCVEGKCTYTRSSEGKQVSYQEKSTLGEPCNLQTETGKICEEELFCNENGICQMKLNDGKLCKHDDMCNKTPKHQLFCAWNPPGTHKFCQVDKQCQAVGEKCEFEIPKEIEEFEKTVQDSSCCKGTNCIGGKCAQCIVDYEDCLGNEGKCCSGECSKKEKKCLPKCVNKGEFCNEKDICCAKSNKCLSNKCQDCIPANQKTCSSDSECCGTSFCFNYKCCLKNTEKCYHNDECCTQKCNNGLCEGCAIDICEIDSVAEKNKYPCCTARHVCLPGNVCGEKMKDDMPCTYNFQCISGTCKMGKCVKEEKENEGEKSKENEENHSKCIMTSKPCKIDVKGHILAACCNPDEVCAGSPLLCRNPLDHNEPCQYDFQCDFSKDLHCSFDITRKSKFCLSKNMNPKCNNKFCNDPYPVSFDQTIPDAAREDLKCCDEFFCFNGECHRCAKESELCTPSIADSCCGDLECVERLCVPKKNSKLAAKSRKCIPRDDSCSIVNGAEVSKCCEKTDVCRYLTMSCQPKGTSGNPCVYDFECNSPFHCAFVLSEKSRMCSLPEKNSKCNTARCHPYPIDFEQDYPDDIKAELKCCSGYFCVDSFCKECKEEGQACDSTVSGMCCEELKCENDKCVPSNNPKVEVKEENKNEKVVQEITISKSCIEQGNDCIFDYKNTFNLCCGLDIFCISSSKKCSKKLDPGSPCISNFECNTGNCYWKEKSRECIDSPMKCSTIRCQPYPTEFQQDIPEDIKNLLECCPSYYCKESFCHHCVSEGSSCGKDEECCDNALCVHGACKLAKGPDEVENKEDAEEKNEKAPNNKKISVVAKNKRKNYKRGNIFDSMTKESLDNLHVVFHHSDQYPIQSKKDGVNFGEDDTDVKNYDSNSKFSDDTFSKSKLFFVSKGHTIISTSCEGKSCTEECCGNLKCVKGKCQKCIDRESSYSCDNDTDCCSSLICKRNGEKGKCVPSSELCSRSFCSDSIFCCENASCCNGKCTYDSCNKCKKATEECTFSSSFHNCCPSLNCVTDGTSEKFTCQKSTQPKISSGGYCGKIPNSSQMLLCKQNLVCKLFGDKGICQPNCVNFAEKCDSSKVDNCCPGFECKFGRCLPEGSCLFKGMLCESNDDCCEGMKCSDFTNRCETTSSSSSNSQKDKFRLKKKSKKSTKCTKEFEICESSSNDCCKGFFCTFNERSQSKVCSKKFSEFENQVNSFKTKIINETLNSISRDIVRINSTCSHESQPCFFDNTLLSCCDGMTCLPKYPEGNWQCTKESDISFKIFMSKEVNSLCVKDEEVCSQSSVCCSSSHLCIKDKKSKLLLCKKKANCIAKLGGDCSEVSPCCKGLKCLKGIFSEKIQCIPEAKEGDNCLDDKYCESKEGKMKCKDGICLIENKECARLNESCTDLFTCCSGMECIADENEFEVCKKISEKICKSSDECVGKCLPEGKCQ